MLWTKPLNIPILLALLALSGSVALPTPASGLIASDYGADSSYFALQYQKNQEPATRMRAVHPQQLSVLKPHGKADNSVLFNEISYDVQLSSVNYAIEKPQAFERYLEGKIKQESKKLGYSPLKLTPAQLAELSLQVTRSMIVYDNRMVRSSGTYDKKLDDKISRLALDRVAMEERIGVCRQFAALYAHVVNHIVRTSSVPALKAMRADEVISYDYNHAYVVIFNTGSDKKGAVVEMTFIDPSAGLGRASLKTADALGVNHDALFSGLVKSARWNWTTDETESILKQLLMFRQQGDFSALQASAELIELYNNTVTPATSVNTVRASVVKTVGSPVVASEKVAKNQKAAYAKVEARYRANLSYFKQMQSILQGT